MQTKKGEISKKGGDRKASKTEEAEKIFLLPAT